MSDVRSLRVDALIDAVAAETPAPGGGAVAAIVTSLAAALAAMAARFSVAKAERPEQVAALAARADALRRASAPLADADGAAYLELMAAVRMPREPDPQARQRAVAQAASRAADVPLSIVAAAAEVAGLAAGIARDGNRNLRGDAAAAAMLASAAADSAAVLVAENLSRTPDDPRLARATDLVATARGAAARARALFPLISAPLNDQTREVGSPARDGGTTP